VSDAIEMDEGGRYEKAHDEELPEEDDLDNQFNSNRDPIL
jgi:hypothetical protein